MRDTIRQLLELAEENMTDPDPVGILGDALEDASCPLELLLSVREAWRGRHLNMSATALFTPMMRQVFMMWLHTQG